MDPGMYMCRCLILALTVLLENFCVNLSVISTWCDIYHHSKCI